MRFRPGTEADTISVSLDLDALREQESETVVLAEVATRLPVHLSASLVASMIDASSEYVGFVSYFRRRHRSARCARGKFRGSDHSIIIRSSSRGFTPRWRATRTSRRQTARHHEGQLNPVERPTMAVLSSICTAGAHSARRCQWPIANYLSLIAYRPRGSRRYESGSFFFPSFFGLSLSLFSFLSFYRLIDIRVIRAFLRSGHLIFHFFCFFFHDFFFFF